MATNLQTIIVISKCLIIKYYLECSFIMFSFVMSSIKQHDLTIMDYPTQLLELKAKYPNLAYDSEAFYPTDAENDPYYDHFLCDEGTSDSIDADHVIVEHYRWLEQNSDIDANWVKDHFGNFKSAFLNAI